MHITRNGAKAAAHARGHVCEVVDPGMGIRAVDLVVQCVVIVHQAHSVSLRQWHGVRGRRSTREFELWKVRQRTKEQEIKRDGGC